jgi:hypothetical protein
MSFYKKVDNIIYDLKDINKMYFSLQNKNKNLTTKLKKYEKNRGAENHELRGETRPIGYGTNLEDFIDTTELPAAGGSSHTDSSHNQWTTSLRRWW